MENVNYFALAIPFFIGGMIIELIYQWVSRRPLYRFDDLIANLSCGIGQQVIDVFLKILILGVYATVYEHIRLFTIPPNIYTYLLLFILIDFCFYWFHRFAHQINILWGTHIVHHQSEEFNFSVALRQSWFDNLFNILFYLPLALMGFDTLSFFVLFSFNTIYQFLIHTKLIGRLGVLEYVLNTPSHHRVHHGRNHQYIDKNYGGVFIIWDKLFKTFEKEKETVVYGITTPIISFNPVVLNFSYWICLFKDLRNITDFSQKLKYLFSRPGTIPSNELKVAELPKQIDYKKRVISHISSIRNMIYIGWSFLLIVIKFVVFLDYENTYTTLEKIIIACYALGALTILGAILSVKKNFYGVEFTRIIFSTFILWVLIKDSVQEITIILTVYLIFNLIMLILFNNENK